MTAAGHHLRLVSSRHLSSQSPGDRLIEFARPGRGLRVVEFTYGPPRLTWRLQAEGCGVAAIDLAVIGAAGVPEEWQAAFDAALITCALHQAPDPQALLAAAASCVAPGGVCGGLEPTLGASGNAYLAAMAEGAGLSLVETQEIEGLAAVLWRARVPGSAALPQPSLLLAA